jgi:hypothetical protein
MRKALNGRNCIFCRNTGRAPQGEHRPAKLCNQGYRQAASGCGIIDLFSTQTREKIMKTARILLAAALTTAALPALAGDWKFLPVTEKNYTPAFVASVTGGVMDPQHVKSSDAWGLELAMNCGLLQTPTGIIRTKLSVTKFDKGGLDLTSVELNPRWTTPIAKDLTLGVGPGIGWVKADSGNRTTDMFAWQVGADLDYRIGQLNLGLGARWQDTVNKTVSTGNEGADNWLVQAKVGVAF